MPALDWQGVLAGQPLQWILSGFLTTLWVTLAGIALASLLALLFMLLRLSGGRVGKAIVSGWVSLFRNTPLLVQLLFWYFAAWNGLPQAFRDAVNADHIWSILPGDVWWFTPEFLCSAWGLGVFNRRSGIRLAVCVNRATGGGARPGFLYVARVSLHPAAAGAGKRLAAGCGTVSQPDEALLARQRDWLRRAHLSGQADRKL